LRRVESDFAVLIDDSFVLIEADPAHDRPQIVGSVILQAEVAWAELRDTLSCPLCVL